MRAARRGAATGTLNVTAGNVTLGPAGGAGGGGRLGRRRRIPAPGTVNQSGGTITTGTGGVEHRPVDRGTDARAVYNLNGGTLATNKIFKTVGERRSTSTAARSRRRAANTTFLQGLDAANVKAGGAVFDTNGFNITVAQPLLAAGGGLTKQGAGTLTLSGANTYNGAGRR